MRAKRTKEPPMHNSTQANTTRVWRRLRIVTEDCAQRLRPERYHLHVSENSKTGSSINVPIATTCQNKTAACTQYCYGLLGPISLQASIQTHVENQAVLNRLATASYKAVKEEADYSAAVLTVRGHNFLRWNGVGDLSLGSVRLLRALS